MLLFMTGNFVGFCFETVEVEVGFFSFVCLFLCDDICVFRHFVLSCGLYYG